MVCCTSLMLRSMLTSLQQGVCCITLFVTYLMQEGDAYDVNWVGSMRLQYQIVATTDTQNAPATNLRDHLCMRLLKVHNKRSILSKQSCS